MENFMRKIHYIFLITLILITSFSGCAKKDNVTTEESKPTVTQQPVQVTPTPATLAQTTPTLSPNTYDLTGYTPLGVKIERNNSEEEYLDYIFINSNEGWKATYDPMGMFKEGIILYKTEDGGKNWSKLTGTDEDSFTIPLDSKTGLIFTDSKQGFITTQIPQPGYVGLFRTLDGGSTWEQQQIPVPEKYSNAEFSTYAPVFFSDKDALLLTCEMGDTTEPVVFATHDGGDTWKQIGDKEDTLFQWSFSAYATDVNNGSWTVTYNKVQWTSANGVTWEH
jgi:hypothetical protein